MSNIKYLSDGRKVAVIGSLNSQEKIVQEIFVQTDGIEIPSGENFVVKSLHDTPVIPWRAVEKDRFDALEKRYASENQKMQIERNCLEADHKLKCRLLSEKINWAADVIKTIAPEQFERLRAYMCGEMKWVIFSDYCGPKLLELNEKNELSNDEQIWNRALKMVVISGKIWSEDGNNFKAPPLDYNLNQYRDGSGSSGSNIEPFTSYETALVRLKEMLIEKGPSEYTIKEGAKYGFVFPDEMLAAYKAKSIETLKTSILQAQLQVDKFQNMLNEFQ